MFREMTAVFTIIMFFAGSRGVLAQEHEWKDISGGESDIRVLLCPRSDEGMIFAGRRGSLFKSINEGKSWRRVLGLRGGNNQINSLVFDCSGNGFIYAATDNGLYRSKDSGERWDTVFRNRRSSEDRCSAVLARPGAVFLGTGAGIFTSRDEGRSWQKAGGVAGGSHILNIEASSDGRTVYFAASAGIFRSSNNGKDWDKVFIVPGSEYGEAGSSEGEGDTTENEQRLFSLNFVKTDPNDGGRVYFSSSQGVYRSDDRGDTWNKLTDHGLPDSDVRMLAISDDSRVFALTRSDIYIFYAGHWTEISLGLSAGDLRYIALGGNRGIYAAGERGIFKAVEGRGYSGAGGGMLQDYLGCEPRIRDVQDMAIRYAEVSPEKISQWRKSAEKKAMLPKVSIGVDRNSTDLWHWESGSSVTSGDDLLRRGKDSIDWDVSLTWDLSDLIWNESQTSIDVRSKLMVELREDILDQVNKLYYERLRVKFELDNLGIGERAKRFDKQLKLEELTASLDSLTAGYYSEQLLKMAEERSG
jgi:photosystem II stability/assembly factor-like uncharacterized protein